MTDCKPTALSGRECGFSNMEKWKMSDYAGLPVPYIKPTEDPEFIDFLDEFPIMTLPKGTILCHSSDITNIFPLIKKKAGDRNFVNLNNLYWWNNYYPGQQEYGGGWFTYETSYGGPHFGLNLYYELQTDISLLFIPNIYAEKYAEEDPEYFDEFLFEAKTKKDEEAREFENITKLLGITKDIQREMTYNETSEEEYKDNIKESIEKFKDGPFKDQLLNCLNLPLRLCLTYISRTISEHNITKITQSQSDLERYSREYSGSHLVEGVKNWMNKGYKKIDHPLDSYADELSKKIRHLGFNGYISCDECEVFLSHDIMKLCLERPFMVENESDYSLTRDQADLIEKYNQGILRNKELEITSIINRNLQNRNPNIVPTQDIDVSLL